jgi:hypothetical protein
MLTGNNFSIKVLSNYPLLESTPTWKSNTEFVLTHPVPLLPNTTYAIELNPVEYFGFKDLASNPLATTTITFCTGALPVVTYSIRGYVKDSANNPLSNVVVNLSGKVSKSTTTAEDGSYVFYELTSGSYTVTPIKDGWSFAPVSRTTETLSANITDWNFVGTQVVKQYTISGYVKDSSGNGINGVTITLSGTVSKSTTTTSSGYYEFLDLLSTGTYTVTPTKSGWKFEPVSRTTTTLVADITDCNFTGTQIIEKYSIVGVVYVKDSPNKNIPAVVIQLLDETGNKITSFTTDDSGQYEFKNLDGWKNYTIIPKKENWDFEPSSYTIYLVTNTIINFDGIYRLTDITPTKIDLPLGENNQIVTVEMPKHTEVKIIVEEKPEKPKEQRGTVNPDKGEGVGIVFNPNKKPDEYIGQKFTIRIFTLTGKLVEEFTKIPQTADDTWIKWLPKDIASGIYIVYVEGPGVKVHKKIAIVR